MTYPVAPQFNHLNPTDHGDHFLETLETLAAGGHASLFESPSAWRSIDGYAGLHGSPEVQQAARDLLTAIGNATTTRRGASK